MIRRADPTTLTGAKPVPVQRVGDAPAGRNPAHDWLAVEAPLEIRVGHVHNGRERVTPVTVTMRTPGDDGDLAAGFLATEGILREPGELVDVVESAHNAVRADLVPTARVSLKRLQRNFASTASCGVCGKTTLDALDLLDGKDCPVIPREGFAIPREAIHGLPAALRAAQAVFDHTGGLHAAGLFDETGRLMTMREDIGRHNAVDKLVGARVRSGRWPLSDCLLLVSGRGGYEIVQKALRAGIAALAAVGAPSSLAAELAAAHGMTLLGFVRDGRYNIYSGDWRLT